MLQVYLYSAYQEGARVIESLELYVGWKES
jgi:hypothetical protein